MIIKRKFLFILIFFTSFTLVQTVEVKSDVDFILVDKGIRKLTLMKDGKRYKSYSISLGFDPIGHKMKQGDGRTPEGLYIINSLHTNSDFYLSLKISYPNKWDLLRAESIGENPGGQIMIHGLPNGKSSLDVGHLNKDWTNGCIAVHNYEIKEIFNMVVRGTPVFIRK